MTDHSKIITAAEAAEMRNEAVYINASSNEDEWICRLSKNIIRLFGEREELIRTFILPLEIHRCNRVLEQEDGAACDDCRICKAHAYLKAARGEE